MWMLDHLPDIESDMSVFHRVDDIYSMPGPLFFSRAYRLPAYQGVMQARVAEAQERERKRDKGQVKDFGAVASKEGLGMFEVKKVGGEG